MRVAVHDFAGHPFVFTLSHELAARGHQVRHFYFADDPGPKGSAEPNPNLSVEPIRGEYSKGNLFKRRAYDIAYGRDAARLIKAWEPDVLLSANTPLDAQEFLIRTGIPFVNWVQDLHSEAMLRLLGRRFGPLGYAVAAWYRRMEFDQFRRSDAAVLISEDFKVPVRRSTVIHNWGAIDRIPLRPKDNAWARRHEISGFTLLYSGTLGLKHSPDLLVKLAEGLPESTLILTASGVGVGGVLAPNIRSLGLQPIEDFPDVLGSADVCIALLDDDAGAFSVPSKVLSYLCAGKPIILSAPKDNLAARIVEQSGAGLVVPPDQLLAAARTLRDDEAMRMRCGAAARAYAEEHFDIARIGRRFETVLQETIGQPQVAA